MMNRRTTAIVAGLLIVAAIGAAPLASAVHGTNAPHGVNESNTSAGDHLTAVIGVQSAEVEHEVDRRAFGLTIAQAASNESRADVVRENLGNAESRLSRLAETREQLEAAKERGSISNGSFNARMTVLAAQTAKVQSQLNASEEAATDLPADLLERKGINVSAIQTLKQNASELTGPDVAAIARSIAGPAVGQPIGHEGPPGVIGPPDGVGQDGNESTKGNGPVSDDRPDGPPDDASGSESGAPAN